MQRRGRIFAYAGGLGSGSSTTDELREHARAYSDSSIQQLQKLGAALEGGRHGTLAWRILACTDAEITPQSDWNELHRHSRSWDKFVAILDKRLH